MSDEARPTHSDLLAAIEDHHRDFVAIKLLVADALRAGSTAACWDALKAVDRIVR